MGVASFSWTLPVFHTTEKWDEGKETMRGFYLRREHPEYLLSLPPPINNEDRITLAYMHSMEKPADTH